MAPTAQKPRRLTQKAAPLAINQTASYQNHTVLAGVHIEAELAIRPPGF